ALAHLGSPVTAEITELDLGYRVPAPIIEFANPLLAVAAPDVLATRSVRDAGEPPELLACEPDEVAATVATRVAELAERWSSVGVVVPDDLGEVRDRLQP